jgi:hypothetical protein
MRLAAARIAGLMLFPESQDEQELWQGFCQAGIQLGAAASIEAHWPIVHKGLAKRLKPVAKRQFEDGLQVGQILTSKILAESNLNFGYPDSWSLIRNDLGEPLSASRRFWARHKTKAGRTFAAYESISSIEKRHRRFRSVSALWAVRAATFAWGFELPWSIDSFPTQSANLPSFLRQMELARRAAVQNELESSTHLFSLSGPVLSSLGFTDGSNIPCSKYM